MPRGLWASVCATFDVRYWSKSGKHLLAASVSEFDPACVKTRMFMIVQTRLDGLRDLS